MSTLSKSEYFWKQVAGGFGVSATELLIQGGYFGGVPPKGHRGKKDYNTVAVRFLHGGNLHKAYTYRVKKGAKLRLGQEVVVPTERDGYVANTVAIVVELHKTPQDLGPYNYKFVAGTVNAL